MVVQDPLQDGTWVVDAHLLIVDLQEHRKLVERTCKLIQGECTVQGPPMMMKMTDSTLLTGKPCFD